MSRSLLALLLLALISWAQAGEYHCQATQPGESNELLVWGDLVLEESWYAGRCNLRVRQPHATTPRNFRHFSFNDDGEIFIYSEFNNPGNPTSTFATSGTKNYYLFPRVAELKAVFDESQNEFYIRMPSGDHIFFRNDPMRIDEQRTTDLKVVQQEVAWNNQGGISLSKPSGVLLNLGYLQGGSERAGRILNLEDGEGLSCSLPHASLFDYYRKRYEIHTGSCLTEPLEGCHCVEPGTARERTICEYEYSLTQQALGNRVLDGYRPKAEIEEVIETGCPTLASLEDLRGESLAWIEDLDARSGADAPPRTEHAPSVAEEDDGPKWSFNLGKALESLFN